MVHVINEPLGHWSAGLPGWGNHAWRDLSTHCLVPWMTRSILSKTCI
jgi:hypothetical protein